MNASAGGKEHPLADFILLNEEIAALVRARIPLEAHLTQLGSELPGKAGGLAERVGRRLELGESLAQAMDAECLALPAAYRAALVAGSRSGKLASALESLVDSAVRIDQLRRISGAAILYPLIVLIVACLFVALVLLVVVPNFEWVENYRLRPIAWLAHSPEIVLPVAILIPTVCVCGAAWWWHRSGRLGSVRAARYRLLAWIPGARRMQRWSQAAIFCDMLLMLVEGGVPLDESLELVAEATDDARLRAAALRLAGQIRTGSDGSTNGAPAATQRVAADEAAVMADLPVLIRLALRHAQNRALLESSLRRAAELYHRRAARAAQWCAEYVPILLTVAIAGTITIAFTLFVFWPYAAMLQDFGSWNWR